MAPFRVFDPEGKVKDWLDIGRTVHVWRNVDLSSPDVGALAFTATVDGQTPRPPHWRYDNAPIHSSVKAEDFQFFEPIGIASGMVHIGGQTYTTPAPRTTFTDSAAGFKAAHNAAEALRKATPELGVTVPIGRKFTAYTVQRLDLESSAKRTDGRALATHHMIAVIEWSLIDRYDTASAPDDEGAFMRDVQRATMASEAKAS